MKNIDGFNKKYSGLSYSEVILSQERHGKNQLSTNQQFTFIFKILHFFKEPMFLLLGPAGAFEQKLTVSNQIILKSKEHLVLTNFLNGVFRVIT